MAIRLITGGPGAGKSYFMVKHLVDKYFDYDKDTDTYKRKPDHLDVHIFTNLDELALDHIDLAEAIKKSGKTVEGFFSLEFQKSIRKKYNRIVYIIDEAPMYFRSRFYNTDVFSYFEYHRHLGDDIYLIAIDRYKLSKEISTMAETEFRAVKRSLSFMGELKYNELMQGEIVSRKVFKPEKRIFRLYKSFTHQETEKIKKTPLLKIIVAMVILFPIIGCYFIKRVGPDKSKAVGVHKTKDTAKTQIRPHNTDNQEQTKKKLIQIRSFAMIEGKLFFIIDPISGMRYDPELYEYQIVRKANSFYAFVDQDAYEKYMENRRNKKAEEHNQSIFDKISPT